MSEGAPSDPRVAAHMEKVREFSRPGGPLSADNPLASINNPAWFDLDEGDAVPVGERAALHQALLDRFFADVPQRAESGQPPRAVVMAGPPGSGKGWLVENVVDPGHELLTVDADQFKVMLLNDAVENGWLDQITPEAIRQDGGFKPLELASLVHEESSMLAVRARSIAMHDRIPLLLDTVLSNPDKAVAMGQALAAAGYQIEVVDNEVSYEVSKNAIRGRWQEGYEQAIDRPHDPTVLGGRWVPTEYVDAVFPNGPDHPAASHQAAQRLATECPAVVSFKRYQDRGKDPVVDQVRDRVGAHLRDREPGAAVRVETSRATTFVRRSVQEQLAERTRQQARLETAAEDSNPLPLDVQRAIEAARGPGRTAQGSHPPGPGTGTRSSKSSGPDRGRDLER